MNRSSFNLALCSALLLAGCGSSKPIQEEPNAPTGASPTIPGPQTGTEPTAKPGLEPPPNPNAPTAPAEGSSPGTSGH
jgi:hypothetical protein